MARGKHTLPLSHGVWGLSCILLGRAWEARGGPRSPRRWVIHCSGTVGNDWGSPGLGSGGFGEQPQQARGFHLTARLAKHLFEILITVRWKGLRAQCCSRPSVCRVNTLWGGGGAMARDSSLEQEMAARPLWASRAQGERDVVT